MEKEKLTEKKIQQVLNKFFASPRYIVDGLFVFKWESDKLLWTQAGYIYEFEIKISRADFQNDFKHKAEKHLLLNSRSSEPSDEFNNLLFENLHKQERKKYPHITIEEVKSMRGYPEDTPTPNYFYYAVPEGLIKEEDVPQYAGLVYITDENDIKIVKKAQQLHAKKYSDQELNLSEKFYYNMHTALRKAREAEKDKEQMKALLDEELSSHGKDMTYSQLEEEYKKAVHDRNLNAKVRDSYKEMYFSMVEGADLNTIERHLFIDEIEKYDPSFNCMSIFKEADRIYKERYPDRK